MTSKVNQAQAHSLADVAVAAQYNSFVSDVHSSIKRDAQAGRYEKTVDISRHPTRKFDLVRYFTMFGFEVTITSGNRVVIKW